MKSNQDWIEWGTYDPLFGVATWPGRDRKGPNPWTNEAFYELGRSDWHEFLAKWEAYGLDSTSCVEIGSGTGRLTRSMVQDFSQVYATDVSIEMLNYARGNIEAKNIEFLVTDGLSLPLESHSVTAAFSTHVFQHFDSIEDGAAYFAELSRVLVSKGSIMVHLPMHVFPGAAKLIKTMRMLYSARKALAALMARHRRLTHDLFRSQPPMRRLSYEMVWVMQTLRSQAFVDVEFVTFPVSSNDNLHSFVFARRS